MSSSDLNRDGCVDLADLNLLMEALRSPVRDFDARLDLNGDGVVNVADARFLATRFTSPGGKACGLGYNSTSRVTTTSAGYGLGGTGSLSVLSAISRDGRYVAYCSYASNLVAGDTNNSHDIFLRDRQAMTTTRLSVDSSGQQGNQSSCSPSISADGRYVAFESDADNLVTSDRNGFRDVFLHDRLARTTRRISVATNGAEGNGHSGSPALSADGRHVSFESQASNLVANDTNGVDDVFVHDRQTGLTTRASVDSAGAQGNGVSGTSGLSADGRFIVFGSAASNLVAGDSNGRNDVFVHDRQTGFTERISVDNAGREGNQASSVQTYGGGTLSADGRFVVFVSSASNLVPGDTNGKADIFVRDRQSGSTTRISVNSSGSEGQGSSGRPSISADGRFVAYQSDAANLVPADLNGAIDIFVYDRWFHATQRVNVNNFGFETANTNPILEGPSWRQSMRPAISGDGRYVAFESNANNLVPDDANSAWDIFVFDRQMEGVPTLGIDSYTLVSATPANATETDYTYRARLENRFNTPIALATAMLDPPASAVVMDGQLMFLNIPARGKATSADTFTLRLENRLAIELPSLRWQIESTPPLPVITPDGGTAAMPGVATATFPPGAFLYPIEATVRRDDSAATRAVFDEYASLYRVGTRMDYAVVLTSGSVPPDVETVDLLVDVPAAFGASVQSGYRIALFARIRQEGANGEVVDIFEPLPAALDATGQRVEVALPSAVFTAARRADRIYEAVIMLASTPGPAEPRRSLPSGVLQQEAQTTCEAEAIAWPLPSVELGSISSGFSQARRHPVLRNTTRPHYGIDIVASVGDTVVAAADGVVERSKVDGGVTGGFGDYIVIRHSNGAATLYGHLSQRLVQVGDTVVQGSTIGRAGSTGLSSGSHLDFRYMPDRTSAISAGAIDPTPCVRRLILASITAGGTQPCVWGQCLISVELLLNGRSLGLTPEGQANGTGAATFPVRVLADQLHRLFARVVTYNAPLGGSLEVSVSENLTLSGGTHCPTDTMCHASVGAVGDTVGFELYSR